MNTPKTALGIVLALVIATTTAIFGQVHILTDTNGVLLEPKAFFTKNTNALRDALDASGYSPSQGDYLPRTGGEIPGGFSLIRTNAAVGQFAFGGRWAPHTNDAFAFVYYSGVLTAGPVGSFEANYTPPFEWFRLDDTNWEMYVGVTAPWFIAGTTNLLEEINLKQAKSDALSSLSTNNAASLTNLNASTAFSTGTVPIARLATGTPDGTKFIRDDGTLVTPTSGVSLSGTNAWTGPNSFSADTTVSNLTVTGTHSVNTLEADSLVLANPIGVTAVATNAEAARAALGLTIDTDVQGYSALLRKIATNSWANGDMPLHDGSTFGSVASTAAGRALLSAASASVQWVTYLLPVASTNGAYNSTSWDGITDRLVTLDQFRDAITALPGGSNAITSVTAPLTLTNGVLSIDTSGLGGSGSGGYTYLVTNSLGTWQGRDSSTNWTIISTTISSNDVPTATGRFVDGGWSLVASNNSGSTATAYLDVSVGGNLIFRDSYSWSSGAGVAQRPMAAQFWLVRESASTASLIQIGQNVNSSSTPVGHGDFGSTANGATIVTTNIPITWTSNVQFSIAISCDTSVSTNTALGIRVVNAWLRKEASSGGVATDSIFDSAGDLAVGTGANTADKLPVGLIGDRLVWNGTNLVWVDGRTWWEMGPFEGGGTMSSADFTTTAGNGGAAPSAAYAGAAGHPGVVGGTTGTTTTSGYTGFGSRNNSIVGGYGYHFFDAWIKTPSALPSSQPYYMLAGFHDQNSTTPVVDGPGFFRLSTFGDVWQFVSRNNGNETTNSLTATATEDTWYHVRAEVAAGGSNVVFRLNGSTVATNTSNIPTGTSRAYGAQLFIMEDGGTTNQTQTLLFDYMHAAGFR